MSKSKTVKTLKKAVQIELKTEPVKQEVVEVAKVGAPPKSKLGSARELALAVFTAHPDKEFLTDEVVQAVLKKNPDIKPDTIKFELTNLKKTPRDKQGNVTGDAKIHEARREGHQSLLRLGAGSKPFPLNPTGFAPGKVSLMSLDSDLAILNEATAVIAKLQALVQRNSQALEQIQKLKSML